MIASRFHLLKIDDDSDNKSSDDETRRSGASASASAAAKNKKKNNRRKKAANERAEAAALQALAFGTGKTKKNNGKSKKNGGTAGAEQWEEWKEKDEAFVDEIFATDMAEAVMLSTIDYEQKRDVYEAASKDNGGAKSKKGKKVVKTVPLNKFQQMTPAQVERMSAGVEIDIEPKKTSPVKPDKQFFVRVDDEAREELRREERRRLVRCGPRVSSSESGIEKGRVSSSESGIEKGRVSPESTDRSSSPESADVDTDKSKELERIAELEGKLQDEKTKTRRLLQLFKDADLKEKGKLVVDAERANKVAAELTTQVSELHILLEQERSKVHALNDELKKAQEQLSRKRTVSENH